MHIPDQESRGHTLPTGLYFVIGGALLSLTVLTVAASYVNWGEVVGGGFATNIFIAMFIATVKASLVLLYFMHMKYEDGVIWGFGIVYPLLLFALLVGFACIDLFLRVVPSGTVAPEPQAVIESVPPVSAQLP
ncbi:MAG: cytochrome C oxidase subunit IV family protein [Spirochaetales bacterium]|nr:cytochrome C oxidase subunit IV family protein [Leptospiraceae bacterium]MCP5480892.1 cytochrome C oxidase subunit IV family protein [Spirochaetales bacterium]MCP5485272.1 cytochrome C oxidase subunit IV family protein [Spirochaetales bacterium]